MPDFGPEPFGGVYPAAFGDEPRPKLGRELRDFRGLAPARVILPQPALRVEIVFPPLAKGQRTILVVDRNRARTGRVDADPDHFRGVELRLAPGFGERPLDALLEAEQVVAWILPGEMAVDRIEQDALDAGRIVDDPAAKFGAVRATDDERAHRIGPEIDAEGEHQRSDDEAPKDDRRRLCCR